MTEILDLFGTAGDTLEPIPFKLMQALYLLFERGGVFTVVQVFGALLLLGVAGFAWSRGAFASWGRSLDILVKIGVASVLIGMYPEARTSLYQAWFTSFEATRGLIGVGYANLADVLATDGKEAWATTFGSASLEQMTVMVSGSTLAAGSAAAGASVWGRVGSWFRNLNPTEKLRTTGVKALARVGTGVSGAILKNLGKLVVFFIFIFYLPYFLTSFVVLLGILFLPIVVALLPVGLTGLSWLSRWVSAMLSAYIGTLLVPIIFLATSYIAIITPIGVTMNAVVDFVQDMRTNGSLIETDDPDTVSSTELAEDIFTGAETLVSAVTFPATLMVTLIAGLIIGLVGAIWFLGKSQSLISGFIGGVVGTGFGAIGLMGYEGNRTEIYNQLHYQPQVMTQQDSSSTTQTTQPSETVTLAPQRSARES
jgi:hypothetical protein